MYNISSKFPSASGAYFLNYYHPKNRKNHNYFSQRLLDFKDRDIQGYYYFYNLIKRANTNILKCDVGLRALGSSETNSKHNIKQPLYKLLKSGLLKNKLIGHVLNKPITKQMKNAGGKDNRKQILSNTYTCKSSIKKYSSVLILDDVITTGTTINEIIRSIKKQVPYMKIIIFSLSKTYSSSGRKYSKISN
jgi:hypothetical protein